MARTTINFKHPVSGKIRRAPVGFSWTTFLFGVFPALFRGDIKWFAIQLICAMMTMGLSTIVFMFMYNGLYIKSLIGDGYKMTSVDDGDVARVNASVGREIPQMAG